jgi:hypothetical protein
MKVEKVNVMHDNKNFPVVELLDTLFCPHGGVKLVTFKEGLLTIFSHLVYLYNWDEDGRSFDIVRPDFGKLFLLTLLSTFEYEVLL